MKKSDIPERDRKAAERQRLCPFCWHGLRDGTTECDRWACWVTRTDRNESSQFNAKEK